MFRVHERLCPPAMAAAPFFLTLAMATGAWAGTDTGTAKDNSEFRIVVLLSADGAFADELRSCVNREIRKLGDVTIVESDPRFALQAVVGAVTLPAHARTIGYAASMVVIDYYEANNLASNVLQMVESLEPKGSPEREESIEQVMASIERHVTVLSVRELGRVAQHSIAISPDVQSLCTAITADLDVNVIEPARRESAN